MEEYVTQTNADKKEKNDNSFIRGLIFGIIITVCCAVGGKSAYRLYSYYTGSSASFESKARLIYDTLNKKYVSEIDKEKIYEGIYAGMVFNTTDKYSTYIPADSYDDFKQSTSGEYVGIGIVVSVNENKKIEVKHVLEGSNSEKEGIMPGDILLKVEDTEAKLENYYDIVDMVKGKEGTTVKLFFYRPSEDLKFEKNVVRAHVDKLTVAYKMLDNNIGYIRISAFDGVTYDQFSKALEELKAQNMSKLVLDLRDNPGGLLTSVTAVLDEFLDEGVITYTEDRNGKRRYEYSTGDGYDIPIAILVSSSSASAAELCTAALKDRAGAVVIGKNTYGKGVVQTTFPFSDGSAIKITTSRYYTPNGICIDGEGIAPDYDINALPDFELPYISKSLAEFADNDVQLNKAVEILNEK